MIVASLLPARFRMDLRLLALLIGVVLSTVDSSALNLALPTLAAHFRTDAAGVQGAVSLYLVGSALSFLPLSALAGRLGTVRVYRTSLVMFALFSLFIALSPSLPALLVLRFIQGVAGAGIVGLVPGLTAATFPERRGWALGMVAGAVAAGTLLGPPLGGFLVQFAGWRSVFLLNLPFGGIAFLLSNRLGELRGVGLVEGMKRALAAPRFLAALFATLLFFAQTFGTTLLWPFYLEAGGMTPARVGVILLVPPLMLLFMGPWGGRMADRGGYERMSIIGGIVLAIASWLQGWSGLVWPGLIGLGIGRALFQSSNNAAVLSLAPEGTGALASGMLSVSRVAGQALGSFIAGSMWGHFEHQGAGRAYLVTNLALGALAGLAGFMVSRRRK